MEKEIVAIAQKIMAMSQTGLVYSNNEYDTERYNEFLNLGCELLSLAAQQNADEIKKCLIIDSDYVTPKVDIRAVVFNEKNEILLVKEKADGCWSLPGGWADVGFSPKEIAVKEVKEETGFDVVPQRLLAVLDKKCHPHPPAMHYVYKIFIECKLTGGAPNEVFDILDKGFFGRSGLPVLSEERVTYEQIEMMFEMNANPDSKPVFD